MVRSLALLFSSEREADRPVAVLDGETITLSRFHCDVAAAAARLRQAGYRRAAVACRSAYWTAVGWLALAHTGGEMVLPPNSLPATLASYRDKGYLKRLSTTPVGAPRLLAAQILIVLVLSALLVTVIVLVARIAFNVPLPRQFGGFLDN